MTVIYSLSCLVILTGVIIFLILHFIKHTGYCVSNDFFQKQEKIKIGTIESVKIILSSRTLSYIFILVASYSVTINLTEGIWLAKTKEFYAESEQYMNYQGQVVFWTGIFTLFCTVVSGFIIKNKGWKYSALITPMISLFSGGSFFLLIYFEKKLPINVFHYNLTIPIFLSVFFGALQNILIKGEKYSFFDITKEISYIKLTRKLKIQGKAAVEMLGARTGKLASVVFQCIILTVFPEFTYTDIVLPLMMFFILSFFLWVFSVCKLASLFEVSSDMNHTGKFGGYFSRIKPPK